MNSSIASPAELDLCSGRDSTVAITKTNDMVFNLRGLKVSDSDDQEEAYDHQPSGGVQP